MKNVIVAGGSGTLGRAIVEELLNRGYRVAVVDLAPVRPDPRLTAALVGVDLANESAIDQAYAAAVAELSSVEGLVNVAGGFVWEPVQNGSVDNWDRMYRMNLRTAAISARSVLKHMTGDAGAIVNVGAAAAGNPGLGMAPYTKIQ